MLLTLARLGADRGILLAALLDGDNDAARQAAGRSDIFFSLGKRGDFATPPKNDLSLLVGSGSIFMSSCRLPYSNISYHAAKITVLAGSLRLAMMALLADSGGLPCGVH